MNMPDASEGRRPSEGVPEVLVILSSTRESRFGPTVADWVMSRAAERTDMHARLADLRDFEMPYYNLDVNGPRVEPEMEPREWAKTVRSADAFVIVTPEYNYGYPAVLKSALDALYRPWNRKPVAFVSYGGWSGGTRAVQQLRQVVVELQMAPIRSSVVFQFARRLFDEEGHLREPEMFDTAVEAMFDDLVWWANALRDARPRT
jgi:NAD(P)H-dependent FMN reductase